MLIQLLGTASAEGWPGMFCACDICHRSRQAGGKNMRTRSSALIDKTIKIDLSPDTMHHILAHGLDMTAVRHLIITHGHHDHIAADELQYMSWMFVPSPATTPLSLWGPADVVAKVHDILDTSILPLHTRCLEPWKTVPIDGRYIVTPILAQHEPELLCFNYLLSDGMKTLLYASDTGWYEKPTWDFLKNARIDGAVIECSKGPIEGGYMAHLCIPEVIRMRECLLQMGTLAPDSPVVTTHHSHLGGLMHEELEARLNPHGIQVGYDGMTFEI